MSKVDTVLDEIWRLTNQIDESVYKLKYVADVLEIAANDPDTGQPLNGMLWLMRDNIIDLTGNIELYTHDLLALRAQAQEDEEKPKKGKKNV